MAGSASAPTISLKERPADTGGGGDKISKWLAFSLCLHAGVIALLFVMPFLPPRKAPDYPIYTVDLVGGERIGATNLGTELPGGGPKVAPRKPAPETAPPVQEAKPEPKTEKIESKPKQKPEKKPLAEPVKPPSKTAMAEVKPATKEAKKEPAKAKQASAKATASDTEQETADRVRERLIQSAVERAKNRSQTAETASSGGTGPAPKGPVISSGAGEGEGAAALGAGGRGGGVVKGMDYIIYYNRMLSTIKDNWAWVGQKTNLHVVVSFSVKDNGEIAALKIVQPSGDPSYDESVVRAVKKSSPLSAPPESVRKDFADVELTFRPKDLGA
jgi:colicin import membrane protein